MFAAAPRALRPLALRAYSRTAYAPTPLRLGRLAAGVAVVGSAVFASVPISKSLQLEAATQRRTDPLGVLDPAVLAVSTEYLAQLDMAALVRAWFVYAGSSQSALVAAGPWMVGVLESMRDGVPVVGPAVWWVFTSVRVRTRVSLLTVQAMTGTFYAHFVGGPTVPACQPLVDSLGAKGVGLMLNYSAEAAVDGSAVAKGLNELHIGETLHAVTASARLSSSNTVKDVPGAIKPTLLAIKLTGLIFEPALLSRATTALLNSSSYLRGTELPEGTLFPQGPDLSEEDHADLEKLHDGLRSICAEARAGGVRLLMDAEQSWYQPAYVPLPRDPALTPLQHRPILPSPRRRVQPSPSRLKPNHAEHPDPAQHLPVLPALGRAQHGRGINACAGQGLLLRGQARARRVRRVGASPRWLSGRVLRLVH